MADEPTTTEEAADLDEQKKSEQTKDSIQGDSARQATSQKDSKSGAAASAPGPDAARNQAVVASDHPAYRPTDPSIDSAGNRSADAKLTAQFLKASGYKEGDLLGSNASTRTFVTDNGGKYVLSPKGTKVRTLSGPYTPKQIKEQNESGGDEDE